MASENSSRRGRHLVILADLAPAIRTTDQWTVEEAHQFARAFVDSYASDVFAKCARVAPGLDGDHARARRGVALSDFKQFVVVALDDNSRWVALQEEIGRIDTAAAATDKTVALSDLVSVQAAARHLGVSAVC